MIVHMYAGQMMSRYDRGYRQSSVYRLGCLLILLFADVFLFHQLEHSLGTPYVIAEIALHVVPEDEFHAYAPGMPGHLIAFLHMIGLFGIT
ncbi:MAG: hypothetical protein JXK93_09055 [Sphaerochaetaceae bacterium]|nr:hypothetical protein [Sphaerochaetaceae bacterium]